MNSEIHQILLTGNIPKDLPRITSELRAFAENELFQTLFPLSVKAQKVGLGVAFSAYSLNMLNPKSEISAEEAVMALLVEWDISIEEVVFYLVKQYGEDIVLKQVRKFIKTEIIEEQKVRLNTIEYWVKINA